MSDTSTADVEELRWLLERAMRTAKELASAYDRLAQENASLRNSDLLEQNRLEDKIARLQQQIAEQLPSALKEKLSSAEDQIAKLEQQIAEMQPREVAPNPKIDAIVRDVASQYLHVQNRDNCLHLLAHIDELRTELARWNGTHAGRMCEMERINKDREELREALAWVLDSGTIKSVHYIDGKPCPRLVHGGDYDSVSPPEHLRSVLDQALATQGKTEGK